MQQRLSRANRRMGGRLALVVIAMFGFGFALVPLYDVFCELTGFDGRSGRIAEEQLSPSQVDKSRWVTVEFVGIVNSELPWKLTPAVNRMRVHPGAVTATSYYVENRSGAPSVGQAVPNVAPNLASRFFNKTECFCFTQQQLEPGERREMPVRFVVDPNLPANVSLVTLSYTFFKAGTQAQAPDRPLVLAGQ